MIQLLQPICGAREHDSIALYKNDLSTSHPLPDPLATQVVNAAIHLFATSLPLQAPRVQESILEQLSSFLSDNNLHRDPARKAAMSVNIASALFSALKVATKETSLTPGDVRSEGVEKATRELLRVSLSVWVQGQVLISSSGISTQF
jgi:hypothetical protein